MAIVRSCSLVCDEPGCATEPLKPDPTNLDRVASALNLDALAVFAAIALGAGWECSDAPHLASYRSYRPSMKFWCPVHAAPGSRKGED